MIFPVEILYYIISKLSTKEITSNVKFYLLTSKLISRIVSEILSRRYLTYKQLILCEYLFNYNNIVDIHLSLYLQYSYSIMNKYYSTLASKLGLNEVNQHYIPQYISRYNTVNYELCFDGFDEKLDSLFKWVDSENVYIIRFVDQYECDPLNYDAVNNILCSKLPNLEEVYIDKFTLIVEREKWTWNMNIYSKIVDSILSIKSLKYLKWYIASDSETENMIRERLDDPKYNIIDMYNPDLWGFCIVQIIDDIIYELIDREEKIYGITLSVRDTDKSPSDPLSYEEYMQNMAWDFDLPIEVKRGVWDYVYIINNTPRDVYTTMVGRGFHYIERLYERVTLHGSGEDEVRIVPLSELDL